MKCSKNVIRVSILAVLWGLAAGGTAWTQGPGVLEKGKVDKLEIAAWNPDTHDEIAQIQLGDTLEIAAGESVLLRLYVPRGHGPGDQRYYLPARFYVAEGGGAELSEVDEAKGSCVLTASKKGREAEVRYELGEGIEVARPFLAEGRFKVAVKAPAAAPPPLRPDVTKAEDMVGRLYRGILMRDAKLEKPESREWVDRVARGGYPELVEVAEEIVASEESQVKVVERGNSQGDRLLAIYRELLDLEPSEVDRYQWRDHLEMMVEGDVTAVVMDIVRSPEFRRVHGYNQ